MYSYKTIVFTER